VCIAVGCSVSQCVAVCCNVMPEFCHPMSVTIMISGRNEHALQCVVMCCSVLQFVAECYSVLQCVEVCCSVMPSLCHTHECETY